MYKNRKYRIGLRENSTNNHAGVSLNPIDENASIKIAKRKAPDVPAKIIGDTTATAVRGRAGGGTASGTVSEENIPFSQEYTQRYLSQRSIAAASLARTQSRHNSSSQRPPNSYCELVLIRAGVQLDVGDTFVLTCDHVAFVNKLRESLIRSANYPENVQTFTTGLAQALASRSRINQKLLTGCTISVPGEECVYQSQDSMFANFFAIDFLREPVFEVLLVKLGETAKAKTVQMTIGEIPLLPLLLTQLRYLSLTHSARIFAHIKDVFDEASSNAKWEIIALAELILAASEHDAFAELLIERLSLSKEFFQAATIQALASLSLSTRMQEKLRSKILSYIRDEEECAKALLPLLVKFLLKAVEDEQPDVSILTLVRTLREILINYSKLGDNDENLASTSRAVAGPQAQTELFGQIQQVLIRSRKLYNLWQKTIAGLPSDDFHAVDFIVLLILLNIREENALYLSNILRRRIKQDTVTVELLQQASTTHSAVLEEQTSTLMQLLHDFLRERTKSVSDFARSSYAILFRLCEGVQKTILKQLLELTCDKSAQNMTSAALFLLRELQLRYPSEIQNWGILLMPLLDRLHELTLPQTRIVMQLVCSVAFPAPGLTECTTLQEQIDMLVRKQLINRLKIVKKQGIIGSVQLIDSIARTEENIVDIDDELLNATYNTVSDLPEGRGQIAANHILRLQASTQHCSESLALFYDELANVCQSSIRRCSDPQSAAGGRHYDKPFLSWLCEMMTYCFQTTFICEQIPTERVAGLELSYQKCINSLSDTTETEDPETEVLSVAINIAGMALAPQLNETPIGVLAPLFRLVRVLHSLRSAGSLEQINALLGCAIVLPHGFAAADDTALDAFYLDCDEAMRRQLLDIQFHCCNWLREAVSSFVTQRESMIRRKVLQRLAELIRIEATIRRWLLRSPVDYVAPPCEFCVGDGVSVGGNVGGGGRGRPATATATRRARGTAAQYQQQTEPAENSLTEANNETTFGDMTGGRTTRKVVAPFDELYGPREIYRPMDPNVMLLMREPFSLAHPLPAAEEGDAIGLNELRFMLVDLLAKLETVTGGNGDAGDVCSPRYVDVRQPRDFMADLSKFLPVIVRNMDKMAAALQQRLKSVNGAYGHADLFNAECGLLKVCLGLSVRLLAAYFTWSDFNGGVNQSRLELLQQSLLGILHKEAMAKEKNKTVDASQVAATATKAFEKWLKYEPAILDLRTAVHLHRLLITLRRHAAAGAVKETAARQKTHAQQLRSFCKTLLFRKWYAYDGQPALGAACNCHLDELVKGFLRGSSLRRQVEILHVVHEEAERLGGGAKDCSMRSFPNIRKANFPLLFRALCETLIAAVSEDILHLPGGPRYPCDGDRLAVWEQSTELLNTLLEIVRALDVPRNFELFLKHSHLYLKLVLQHALPVLEQHLRQTPERVGDLLKGLQVTTRFLHNLCVHSKALRKIAIVNQIPMVRETVEQLLYRVKALLAANKCASVFWMGQLKNKDLHGDEVVSMASNWSNAPGNDNDDEDEHIPEDDESVDETILGETAMGRNADTSTLYTVSPDRQLRGRITTGNDNKSGSSSSRSKCF